MPMPLSLVEQSFSKLPLGGAWGVQRFALPTHAKTRSDELLITTDNNFFCRQNLGLDTSNGIRQASTMSVFR